MGDGDDAACAALHGKQSDSRVFNFTIKQGVANQTLRLVDGAKKMHQHFCAMAAEVKHRAATGLALVKEPVARVLRLWVKAFKCIDLRDNRLNDFAARKQLFDARDDRIKMAIVGDA